MIYSLLVCNKSSSETSVLSAHEIYLKVQQFSHALASRSFAVIVLVYIFVFLLLFITSCLIYWSNVCIVTYFFSIISFFFFPFFIFYVLFALSFLFYFLSLFHVYFFLFFFNPFIFVEILQLQTKFQTAMVSCLWFIWITNSSDHKRVWTVNLLHTK